MEKLLKLTIYFFILRDVSGVYSALDTALFIQDMFCKINSCTNYTIKPSKIPPDRIPVIPPDSLHDRCCKECSCDVSRCKSEGGCCLDTLEDLPAKEESMFILQKTCVYPQLRPFHELSMANALWTVWMVRGCSYLKDDAIVDRCEHPEKYDDLYTKIPVVDSINSVSYQNKFCALCNGALEENLIFWNLEIVCLNGLFNPQDLNSLEAEIKETKDCNLIYLKPDEPGLSVSYCSPVISTCNETGLWKKFDPLIESACHAYMAIYDFRYKNVFCYMCNTADSQAPDFCEEDPGSGTMITFAALLKLPEPTYRLGTAMKDTCDEYHIYDPVLNKCQKLRCKFPKSVKGRQCVNSMVHAEGVFFDVFIELRPLKTNVTVRSLDVVLSEAEHKVIDWLTKRNFSIDLKNMFSVSMISGIAQTDIQTDNQSNEPKTKLGVILVSFRWLVGKATLSAVDYILRLHFQTFELNVEQDRSEEFQATLSHWYMSPNSPYNTRTHEQIFPLILSYQNIPYQDKYGIETLSVFNNCSYVTLSREDVTVDVRDKRCYLPLYNANFSMDDILLDNSSIYMCLELYEHFVSNLMLNTSKNERFPSQGQAKYIVSYVLVLTSICFAFLTLIFYCCFKELRSQPGVNNMLLSLFLVLCQLFFQFGYDRAEDLSSSACAALGVCVHLSWLMLLAWMNACSIHMFRVFFICQTVSKTFNVLKTTSLYIAYSVTVAAIPVIVNIVFALIKSNGEYIGYGGQFCYIKSSELVIYVLTIPLGLIISFNIGLYIIVVVQMNRAKCKMGNRSESYNLASAYAKLSTITGATWLFGFLYLFTEQEWAEYFFVALNATQGIFVFIAFILNKRCFYLLKGSFCKMSTFGTNANAYVTQTTSSRRSMK